ncbi:MAG TPA: ABC transporter substrate-binding protein, partial [Acetobacteraceae bacterium]
MRPLALAAALLAATLGTAAAQPKTLRVSLNTELQVLDPIVTTINATRVFAYMVFDTLVGIDNAGNFRPQMLEGWEVSDDRLTWRFRLREGLEFSDGTPVTAADCVASIRRWSRREALGGQLIRSTEALEVVDDRRFTLKLNRPFAFVIEALGKPGHTIPVM